LITAIIQARMGSSRLPGKTMMEISGKPFLQLVIERTKVSKLINSIVVATTSGKSDDPIIKLCNKLKISYFRGSERDVLDRYYQAALQHNASIIVRITGDDPFKDPEVIDKAISTFLALGENIDYVSNTIKVTYPIGIDVEVFSFNALEKAWKESSDKYDREHVTPYIYNHPELFRLKNIENDKDLSYLRWTIDYDSDMRFTKEVYSRLYKEGQIFFMRDILELLEKEPWIVEINKR
jgi:spore coat polysaccharide biosynthesis protein SpsF